ncbi:hypothetical protein D7231_14555 [Streptomyces klenkii]|uniref:Uncharacterized protein n=2 Tax=Streptomyces klenkii TaxID=1420899 RepID=A0A3B0BJ11_9ACTN|nr:hypothetical protein D7231_14555 [Streptomyces klenkii]
MPLSRPRPSAARMAALTLAAVTALPLGLVCAPAAVADAVPSTPAPTAQVSCRPQAQLYGATADGKLELFTHGDAAQGSFNWPVIGKRIDGSGWGSPRITLGGPGNWIYSINPDGGLYRHRYDPATNTWGTPPGEKIDSGWGTFLDGAARRNRVTIDDRGNIFAIHDDGTLRIYRYDEKTGAPMPGNGRVIDTGSWGGYNLIVAAGDGLLFARQGGDMYRYRYDVDRQQWLEIKSQAWTSGWQYLRDIRSAGGGTLYGLHADGSLFWYRYDVNAGAWVDTGRRKAGWNFETFHGISLSTDACKTPAQPAKPPVAPRPNMPAAIRQSSDKLIQQFYVDERGWLVNGVQRDPRDLGTVAYSTVPGARDIVDQPVITEQADGTPMAFALGKDGHIWMTKRQAGGTWSALKDFGGDFTGAPTVTRNPQGIVGVHAFDRDGKMWYLNQQSPNSDNFIPWRTRDAYSSMPAGYEKSSFLAAGQAASVDKEADRPFILGIDKQGRLGMNRADAKREGWWVWGASDTSGLGGTPAAARGADGKVMAFARTKDGEIWTAKESTRTDADSKLPLNGFFGDGTVLSGVKTAGSPAVAVNQDKSLGVVVRDDKGYVHYARQLGPDGDFSRWSLVASKQAATDPAVVQLADGQWAVFYIDTDGLERMYWLSDADSGSAQPRSLARGKRSTPADPVFTGGVTAKSHNGKPVVTEGR